MSIFWNWWILCIGGVALGRVCNQQGSLYPLQEAHSGVRPYHLRVSHLLPQGLPAPRQGEGEESGVRWDGGKRGKVLEIKVNNTFSLRKILIKW